MSVFSYSLESRKWHLSALLAIRSKHLYSCSEFSPQNEETLSIGPVVKVKAIMFHLYQHLLLKKMNATRGIQICSLTELEQIMGSSAISRVMLLRYSAELWTVSVTAKMIKLSMHCLTLAMSRLHRVSCKLCVDERYRKEVE